MGKNTKSVILKACVVWVKSEVNILPIESYSSSTFVSRRNHFIEVKQTKNRV